MDDKNKNRNDLLIGIRNVGKEEQDKVRTRRVSWANVVVMAIVGILGPCLAVYLTHLWDVERLPPPTATATSTPTSASTNERYLQTWVFYDEVNDRFPTRRKYLEQVINLLRIAHPKDNSDDKRHWHIFLIAHGDSVSDDTKNREVTEARVSYLDQLIETSLAESDHELYDWYSSKMTRTLWSFGKRMLIEQSRNSKEGECQNRRAEIIVTTDPELVKYPYLSVWKAGGLSDSEYDVTNKREPISAEDLKKAVKHLQ